MVRTKLFNIRNIIVLANVVIFSIALIQIQINTNITMIGYKIGDLKEKESGLIETKSELKIQLTKMTTKSNLMLSSKESFSEGNPKQLVSNF